MRDDYFLHVLAPSLHYGYASSDHWLTTGVDVFVQSTSSCSRCQQRGAGLITYVRWNKLRKY